MKSNLNLYFDFSIIHCHQRAPVKMFCQLLVISAWLTYNRRWQKNKYYDHIALLYLETRRCRYQSITCCLFLPICCCS